MDALWGVNVAGYLRSASGTGEAARQAIAALDARGIPVMPLLGPAVAPGGRSGSGYGAFTAAAGPFPVNLVCVNPEPLPGFAEQAGPGFFEDRRTIGFWWWEVDELPARWDDRFALVDEVWAATAHVADAIRRRAPEGVPVTQVRLPVVVPPVTPLPRSRFGLPDGAFVFLHMFDHHSSFARKNPLGLIEAYRRAFPDAGADSARVALAIKCSNAADDPDGFARLRDAAGGRPDVLLLDEHLPAAAKDALVAACDCAVSLHRAEGLGLTLAEAMALGRPAIATGWSGNLDFMDDETGWLVRSSLVPVGPGNAPYPEDAHWAEPDLDHAAALMREAAADPAATRARGLRAAERIRSTHSADAAGRTMETRLEELRAGGLAGGGPVRRGWPFPARAEVDEQAAAARALAATGPREGSGVRRGALRLMRPWTAHAQEVDTRLSDLAAATAEQVRDVAVLCAASFAELFAELRALQARGDELTLRLDGLAAALDGEAAAPAAAQPLEAEPSADDTRERSLELFSRYVDVLADRDADARLRAPVAEQADALRALIERGSVPSPEAPLGRFSPAAHDAALTAVRAAVEHGTDVDRALLALEETVQTGVQEVARRSARACADLYAELWRQSESLEDALARVDALRAKVGGSDPAS